ncbi:MAG TPA: prephenate dehydratase domain-containing protein [Candidatus Obscuribacterales bacterium]
MTASYSFQGAPGAFSHQAAMAFSEQIGEPGKFVPCQTFGQVFANVVSGNTKYGAIPLENSSIGSIAANYDLLWTDDAFIIAEYFLPVHHNLIAFPDSKLENIRTVFSHPAALDQCRRLFKEHPNMAARVHWDTSGSVADVRTSADRSAAAIAGELAAAEYGMKILLPNIEDFTHNATRFGLITKTADGRAVAAKVKAPYKVSFAVELSHKAGSLAGLLTKLASAGANLTKIESRPIGERVWHYRFFMDIELSSPELESKIESAFKQDGENYKSLGKFAIGAQPTE